MIKSLDSTEYTKADSEALREALWITQFYLQTQTIYRHLVSVPQMAPQLSRSGRRLSATYYSFIHPRRMNGWVDLVGWPIADGLSTKWSPSSCTSSAGRGNFADQIPTGQRCGSGTGPNLTLIILCLVSHFNFLFIPCGRLSWLPVSFLLHVKCTLSYRIVPTFYHGATPPTYNTQKLLLIYYHYHTK